MARPREFDQDEAVEKAMHAFWAHGYEATSLDDLCDAMGIGRSSLYHSFGSKRELLFAALDKYDEVNVKPYIQRALDRPGDVREAIGALFEIAIERIIDNGDRRGCFLGNCAAELATDDPEAAKRVAAGLARIETRIYRRLVAAQEDGEIAADKDVRALARFVTSSLQGLRIFGKAQANRAALKDIAKTALACLD